MFRVRVTPAAAVLAAGLSLSGCSGWNGSSNFDPTDWITGEFFDNKTKIPGERKAVFPEGVPGVAEGVPKELIKGNQQAAIEPTVIPAAPEPAPKPAPVVRRQVSKPAPKPQTASAPPQPAPVRAAPQPQVQAPPQPQAQPQTATQWPNPNAPRQAQSAPPQAAWPDPTGQANWPPPNPNTFSR